MLTGSGRLKSNPPLASIYLNVVPSVQSIQSVVDSIVNALGLGISNIQSSINELQNTVDEILESLGL